MATNTRGRELAGVIGFFDDEDALLSATRKARESKAGQIECYSPYPIHGLEEAQGLKRSAVPFFTLAAGLTGVTLAFTLQYWTSAVDWALNVGGKPFNSWPADVPIMFELTVLLGGLTTAAAMILINGLPNIGRRAFDASITRDRFALMIEVPGPSGWRLLLAQITRVLAMGHYEQEEVEVAKNDAKAAPRFDEAAAATFLRGAGAKDVRAVHHEGWF